MVDPGQGPHGFAYAASRERSGVLEGCFRRKLEIDDGDSQAVVLRAVALAQRGDRDAVRYLYVRYADNIYGYVLSIVRDEHDAEDVTQHVFAKLLTAIDRYEQRSVPFSAWILRVARNVALDHLRERRPVLWEEVYGAETSADEHDREVAEGLEEALEALPTDQRTVLLLRHMVGLSPGEIAEGLGRSEGSIHGLHHRGRQSVREALTRLGCAPQPRRAVA